MTTLPHQARLIQIGLRLTEPMHVALKARATQRQVSLNTELNDRLARSLQVDDALSDAQLLRLAFDAAAHFAVAVKDDDWHNDPATYAKGATAVVVELLRRIPGPDKRHAIGAIVSQLLIQLADTIEEQNTIYKH